MIDGARRRALLSSSRSRIVTKELEAELGRMWQRRKPRLPARLAGAGDDQAIRQAASEVMTLRAKEATLGERLDQFKAQRLLELEAKHDRLVKQHGLRHAKVQEVREQLARLKGGRERGACRSQAGAGRRLAEVDRAGSEVGRGDAGGGRAAVPARPRRIQQVRDRAARRVQSAQQFRAAAHLVLLGGGPAQTGPAHWNWLII